MASPDLSGEVINTIADSMFGETRQQMISRRLKEEGVFCYLKHYGTSLPDLPENSGLKVENAGLISDMPDIGMIDSFIVYDPRRVEVRLDSMETRDQMYMEPRKRRKPNIDSGISLAEQRANLEREGWITPFPHSLGRVVRYRPILQQPPSR